MQDYETLQNFYGVNLLQCFVSRIFYQLNNICFTGGIEKNSVDAVPKKCSRKNVYCKTLDFSLVSKFVNLSQCRYDTSFVTLGTQTWNIVLFLRDMAQGNEQFTTVWSNTEHFVMQYGTVCCSETVLRCVCCVFTDINNNI